MNGVTAFAVLGDSRIEVRTKAAWDSFQMAVDMCKKVPGARFRKEPDPHWHYPTSIDTCKALRRVFGDGLRVGATLGDWYRQAASEAQAAIDLGYAEDATLSRVDPVFAGWLRGYQRAGAQWIAKPYRGAGLVADHPGLGKTPETLAGLIEAGISGPVLVVCPKKSVRMVWGLETKRHLPDVPVYLCYGNREKRLKTLDRFVDDMAKDPNALRIVVVVAEMLRVDLGDPCYTKDEDGEPKNKISGACPQRFKGDGTCKIHVQVKAEKAKDKVPVDFSYYDLFDKPMLGGGWAAVILDESHKLLGSLTISKANLMGRGLKLLPYRHDHRRYALSGTPFGKGGRVQGMFGTLNWLWPDEFTSFWRWVGQVFEVEEKVINRWGATAKKILGIKGATGNDAEDWEAFLMTLGPRILRRTKEEMLKELPPKTYVEVLCELEPKQKKQLQELVEWAEIKTPGGVVAPNGSLALLMRSRQLANGAITLRDGKVRFTGESGKLDRLWENLDARGILDYQPGPKLVIASQFNEFLDTIAQRLDGEGVWYYQLDGRTTENESVRIMEDWQGKGKRRVMLLNIKAGGVSINLDAADEMHVMDEDSDPGVMEQLEDRIHRASRNHKVVIYNYRSEGSIDLKRARDVEFRRQLQHSVMDGRRGVADTREMLKVAFEEMEDA